MRVPLLCAALLAGAFAAPVSAQELTWHVGLGAAAELDGRGAQPDFGDVDADTAGTALFGFTHRSGFGAELAYVDLGSLEQSGIADAGYRVDGELWSLGATYAVRWDALEPYAKLGWFSRSEDGTAITIAGPRGIDFDDDGLMAELGLRWHVSEPFALRLGYVHYDFDPESDGSAQLAAEWRF